MAAASSEAGAGGSGSCGHRGAARLLFLKIIGNERRALITECLFAKLRNARVTAGSPAEIAPLCAGTGFYIHKKVLFSSLFV